MNLQDLLNQLQDFVDLFNIGDVNQERMKRALNRAIEYYQRRLGLPCNEFSYEILYYDGNYFYTLPADFNEITSFEYKDKIRNKKSNEFHWQPDDILIKKIGNKVNFPHNYFSVTQRNGEQKIIIIPKDAKASSVLLESFNSFITADKLTAILNASSDISALLGENDKTQKTEGDASAWLKLTASVATPILVIPLNNITLSGLSDKEQFFGIDIYLPDISKVNKIEFLYTEGATNYVLEAKSLNADYSARKNGWNTLKFRFRDVENFNYTNLTNVKLKITFQNMVVNETYTLNLDNFGCYIPDYLECIYYSNYKGKDNAGSYVLNLNAVNDVPLFDKVAPDLILPICLRAAFYLAPQLKMNTEFVTLFFQEAENTIKNLGRSYPRKRTIDYGSIEFSLTS